LFDIFFLQFSFEGAHRARVGLGVLRGPALEDQPDGNGIEVVVLLAPDAAGDDEVGALEDAQVLHGPEAAHVAVAAQLGERLTVAGKQLVEEPAPVPVGERFEDVIHGPDNR
jgi:hypothetical protein